MQKLIIHHVEKTDPPQFEVHRLSEDGVARNPSADLPPPTGPGNALMGELAWYLEHFLDYPFPPQTERAARAEDALKAWGIAAFTALFDNRQAGGWYEPAVAGGLKNLHLQISSDDPRILAWPWEALHDPQRGPVALGCHLERRLSRVPDACPLSEKLPKDRVNILLVVARPFEADVSYRSIARPLVELIEANRLPAEVTVLRPPTFARLREHLGERPDYYHIVHFDGHGAYGTAAALAGGDAHKFQGPQGHLVFETADGKPDLIDAERLSTLLREFRLPAVVLNACQSAAVDQRADSAFASVAASLIQAGVHSVVAMAYSIYVSAAQQFLPAFYRRLFQVGDLAQACCAGRQQMHQAPGRTCARGKFPLQDWLIPVVYQQQPMDFSFAAKAAKKRVKAKGRPEAEAPAIQLPEEAEDRPNPYGLIGRDGAILEMERAMRRPPAGILLHGLGGIGKTTLAAGFLRWLKQTGGLGCGVFWFRFDTIHNAEHVLNALGMPVFGPNFNTAPTEQKVELLTRTFHEHPFVIVWDNFESAAGIEPAGIPAMLKAEDRTLLQRLLEGLYGGATKVLITSRSEEAWLGTTNRYKLNLRGLQGEERWEFCGAILKDLGREANQADPELADLMNVLDGHPLLMRAVLPRIEGQSAASIRQAVQDNLAALGTEGDEVLRKVIATLMFVEKSIPANLRPLLVPLALHERFVQVNLLELMAKEAAPGLTRPMIDQLMGMLGVAGLVRELGQGIYELHPALTGFLRSGQKDDPSREVWVLAFVGVMARVADACAPRPLHKQRGVFHFHGVNFHGALRGAERLGMAAETSALLQSLGAFAQHTWNLGAAEEYYKLLAEVDSKRGDAGGEAGAYHQLGMIAEERRDLDQAEKWYLKSLEIKERFGDEGGAAITYHQLSLLAGKRRVFDKAEKWCLKSLEIKERLGNEDGATSSYHQLGMIAQDRRDLDQAEKWYLKALEINERIGNEANAAGSYFQLGRIAETRGDIDQAERWSLKSLEIEERLGDEAHAAITYHQLGILAEERGAFDQAEKWYLKSLEIKERLGNEYGAANTYHQLGIIAQVRRDFDQAEKWYLKSLEIKERLGEEYGAASTYHQLGTVAQERRDFDHAEKSYLKSLEIQDRLGNKHG